MEALIHIVTVMYEFDPFRFALWDWLELMHLADIVAGLFRLLGFVLFEDFSIVRGQ